MKQPRLLHGEHLPPRIAYQKLIDFLPRLPLTAGRGRPRTDPNALLPCFVYRCLRRLPTLSDLTFALAENPSLVESHRFDQRTLSHQRPPSPPRRLSLPCQPHPKHRV